MEYLTMFHDYKWYIMAKRDWYKINFLFICNIIRSTSTAQCMFSPE